MDSTVSPCGDDFDAAFDRNFALAGFIVNRFLVHHLVRMARSTGGDFESLVIWSSLALQNTAALLGPGAQPLTPLRPDGTFPDSLLRANGLRSSDLAQITGIPRETVRRKLARLQDGGRVMRREDGRWHVAAVAMTADMRDFMRETARNFCETAALLQGAMRNPGS
jgi:DNA-binding transcriptional ArsR family regulator